MQHSPAPLSYEYETDTLGEVDPGSQHGGSELILELIK